MSDENPGAIGAARPPSVVACMPVWKAAPFVEATLQSLAGQTYPHLRVIVCDDASPDDTYEVCQRFVQGRPRFELHRQPRNLGWIGNVNWLLARAQDAQADYLFFAFHDDPLEPGYVQALVQALQAAPHAVLAFSDAVVDYRGARESWVRTMSYEHLDGLATARERLAVYAARKGLWWLPNRGLFRASAARRVGGLRRHLGGEFCADWPWLLHLSLLGAFVRVPQPLVHKVWSDAGLSKSWRWSVWQRAAVIFACFCEIVRADLPAAERVRLAATYWGHWAAALGARLARAMRNAMRRVRALS